MTTTTRAARKRRATSAGQHRCVVLRNGLGTTLRRPPVLCGVLKGDSYVLHPLSLPPGDPYVFRNASRARRAIERTEALRAEIAGCLHREWLLQQFPALAPFATAATYTIERRNRKSQRCAQ